MPLSPPTFTWHIEPWFVSSAMSPGQAPAQAACHMRPVGEPSGVNSWLLLLLGTSESQTLPVKPTPQARLSGAVGQERITWPGDCGVAPAGVPLTYRPFVFAALASNPGFFAGIADSAAAPPPASLI